MSTDAPDGGASSAERGTGGRRAPRLGDSGAPIGSTLSIVLALVAVVAGFFILREITDDDGGSSLVPGTDGSNPVVGQTTTTGENGGTGPVDSSATSGSATPSTEVRTGAVVRVANANNVGGSAGQMSNALGTAGYTMGEPTDAAGAEDQLDVTKVYFAASDARAQAVANSVARTLGGVAVAPMPAEVPIEGELGRATVLVMLGADAAGKPLSELAPQTTAASTNPAVSGTTTTAGG